MHQERDPIILAQHHLQIFEKIMKSLRVITGIHAGSQLDLQSGIYRIGSNSNDDIRITDWTGGPIELTVVDDGPVQVRSYDCGDDDKSAVNARDSETLTDYVPVQFADIVICLGASNVAWPSDLDLLSRLFTKPVEKKQQREPQRYRKWFAITSATTCCLALLAALSTLPSQQAKASAPVDITRQVRSAIAHANVRGLAVENVGDDVSVTGMLESYTEDIRVRKALSDIKNLRIRHRYGVAENDVQNIQEALGIGGAKVTYRGDGHFEIDGVVASLKELDAAVNRVRNDLSENVKDIVVKAIELPKPEVRESFSQLISASSVKYTQTPDGAKHIYISHN